MHVESFYDKSTGTITHVVVDEKTKKCAVIDSVLDYDLESAKITTDNADKVIKYIKDNGYENEWLIETHIHADHITGAFYLRDHIGGKTAIGSGIKQVLETWVPLFDADGDIPLTGEQFDQLFDDGDEFTIGSMKVRVIHTSGHTPACACYIMENSIFVGDTLFNPRIGTARCDFPGGSAEDLYKSIERIYDLPDDTIIYLCHDYPREGEKPMIQVTVGEQKAGNVLLNADTSKDEYVEKRETRDATLSVPRLILPSIQTNMRLGSFGTKSENGIQYIKIPVNVL